MLIQKNKTLASDKYSVDVFDIKSVDWNEWNSFADANHESTFFSSSDYMGVFDDAFIIAVRDKNNRLCAGLPLIIKKFVPIIGRFFKTCSIESSILYDTSYDKEDIVLLKKIVLNSLRKFLSQKDIVYCYITHWVRSNDSALQAEFGFIHQAEATVTIDLQKEEKEIRKDFKSGYRHALNKAIRLNLDYTIKEGLDAADLVKQFSYLRTMTQHKAKSKNRNASMMLKSEQFIHKIMASKHHQSFIATAAYEDQIAHIVLFVRDKNTLYAYLSGSDVALNKKTGAANYLYFKTILFAKSLGIKTLDMGGTPINPDKSHPAYGVYFFKRSFGADTRIFDGGYFINKKIRGFILRKLIVNRGFASAIMSVFGFK